LKHLSFVTAALFVVSAAFTAAAENPPARPASPIALKLDAASPGPTIPDNFAGLSFEMRRLLPRPDGSHEFRADHPALLNLFRTLGLKSLRLGGVSAEQLSVPFPAVSDIDPLFAFAGAAGAHVIFTLRLRGAGPPEAAALAKHIFNAYADTLAGFAIGDAPDLLVTDYAHFRESWLAFSTAINARTAAPVARFCGPSVTTGKASWTRDFAREFSGSGRLALITQHYYPGGHSALVTDAAAGRTQLLSREWIAAYRKFHDSFAPDVLASGRPFRLDEVNGFRGGSRPGVGDTFAAALWSLDFLHWWAAHDAAGVNFHTADTVADHAENAASRDAVFTPTAHGLAAQPLAYGLKAFDLGRHGRSVAASVATNPDDLNLTAYSVLGTDRQLLMTLINKEHGPAARSARVTMPAARGRRTQAIFLSASDGDVSTTSGLTLGGAAITEDGNWSGTWTDLSPAGPDGQLTVLVPAATAVILRFSAR